MTELRIRMKDGEKDKIKWFYRSHKEKFSWKNYKTMLIFLIDEYNENKLKKN